MFLPITTLLWSLVFLRFPEEPAQQMHNVLHLGCRGSQGAGRKEGVRTQGRGAGRKKRGGRDEGRQAGDDGYSVAAGSWSPVRPGMRPSSLSISRTSST